MNDETAYRRTFAENLTVLRKLAGYRNQVEFAAAVEGLASLRVIQRWEQGRVLPDAWQLYRLCEILGATPDELLKPRPLTADERELLRAGAFVVDRNLFRARRGG